MRRRQMRGKGLIIGLREPDVLRRAWMPHCGEFAGVRRVLGTDAGIVGLRLHTLSIPHARSTVNT